MIWVQNLCILLSAMVIITGNGIGDPSSNPGWGDCLCSLCINAHRKGMNPAVFYELIIEQTDFFSLGKITSQREVKL